MPTIHTASEWVNAGLVGCKDLPNDVIILIVEALGVMAQPPPFSFRPSVDAQQALMALILASKSLRGWATPYLYQYIHIRSFRQMAALADSIRCTNSAEDPTKAMAPSRKIKSFCVWDRIPSAYPGDTKWKRDLSYILTQITPTLERINLLLSTPEFRPIRLLRSMNNLKTVVTLPDDQELWPGLGPQTENFAIYAWQMHNMYNILPQDVNLAVFPSFTNLKRVMIVAPSLFRHPARYAGICVDILRHNSHLSYLMIVPEHTDVHSPTHGTLALGRFAENIDSLCTAEGDEFFSLARSVVRIAMPLHPLINTGRGIRAKLDDGTAWDLDTVSYQDWAHLFGTRAENASTIDGNAFEN